MKRITIVEKFGKCGGQYCLSILFTPLWLFIKYFKYMNVFMVQLFLHNLPSPNISYCNLGLLVARVRLKNASLCFLLKII